MLNTGIFILAFNIPKLSTIIPLLEQNGLEAQVTLLRSNTFVLAASLPWFPLPEVEHILSLLK